MSKKRVILLPVLLLVVGAAVFGIISSNQQPGKSAKSDTISAADRRAQIERLNKAGADIAFSNKIVIGRSESVEELNAIKTQCSKAKIFNKQASLIKPTNEELSTLTTNSDVLAKGCAHYVKKIEINQANTKFTDQKKALLSPAGTEICDDAGGCLAPGNFPEYKKLFQEEIELSRQVSQLLSKECSFPELKTICDLTAGYYSQKLVLDLAYDKSLNTTDNTAESAAYENLVFPREQICAEARRITGLADIDKSCSTRGDQALASRYESLITASLAKL